MRKLSWLLFPALLSVPLVAALPSAGAASVPANDAIEEAMGQLQRSMKALGKGITEETRTATLEELVKMEEAIIAAKAQTPDTASAVDEKKRPAFVVEYRTTLIEALKYVCDAESAVVNGKYKDAEGILRGKLGGLKSEGHDKFKGEDEHGGGRGR